ncbi:MAG: polysaccharide export protein, partial [Cyanobacteriota bacterium]
VDLVTPLQNGTQLPELLLQDGDAVIIDSLNIATEKDYDRRLVSQSSLAQEQIAIRVLSYPNNGIGTITLPNGSNFIDALTAIAPNPDAADISDIALIRYDAERGKAVTQVVNGKRALMGDIAQNIPLQNNDVIVIGRTLVAKITYALNIFTQPFRDVLGFLLFFDSLSESADNLFSPGSDSD